MAQVTIHEAEKHLVALIQKALSGEEVIITDGLQPLVKLVALTETSHPRRIGHAKGVILYMADDFDDPLPDAINLLCSEVHPEVD